MTARDFREIGVWAAITAVAVFGIFGTRTAFSEGPNAQPEKPHVTVNGTNVTASAKPAGELYKVAITFDAHNQTKQAQKVAFQVDMVQKDYGASMLSRVPGPSDYKTEKESSKMVTMSVPAGGTASKTVEMQIKARPAPKPDTAPADSAVGSDVVRVMSVGPRIAPTYEVQVEGTMLDAFSASQVWPKEQ